MNTSDKKIMIIDHDEMTIEILKFILKREGYKISIAKDGINALERISTIMPDLVITNIIVPLKSGLEIISHIKQNFKIFKHSDIIPSGRTRQVFLYDILLCFFGFNISFKYPIFTTFAFIFLYIFFRMLCDLLSEVQIISGL